MKELNKLFFLSIYL
ncbi:hypothetical protein OIU79_003669 [Salix purpurea]|uniref:Uncharacterized protein n=1 Tax=Salix purpurea TaxID=77065 RepID=A0A9Q0SHR5_SALPP|nr:hypothetical protein OIU79_003669 [Salix purpurea]